MVNYEEYRKLRGLVKTLDVDNIILAHEMSKPLGLEKQIIHDIDCVVNSYSVEDFLIDKFIKVSIYRIDARQQLMERFKNIELDLEQMIKHFFMNGYILEIRGYESVCYKNRAFPDKPLKRLIKLSSQEDRSLTQEKLVEVMKNIKIDIP